MPAKKKAADTVVAAETEVKKPAAKKPAAKKKTTAAAETAEPAKKTTKKTAEKKTAEKKPAAKKTTKKAAAAPAEEPAKKTVQEYRDVINWKKWEAHNMDWLYIEVNAGDLLNELEAGADNMAACVEAVKDCMLEGDYYIVQADDGTLSVRYYTDNLSEWRRKYSEVN